MKKLKTERFFGGCSDCFQGISSHEELCEVKQADDDQIADASLCTFAVLNLIFCYKKLNMHIFLLEQYP